MSCDLEVKHEGLVTFLETHVKVTRPGIPIEENANAKYAELMNHLLDVAAVAKLPAGVEFRDVRRRAAGVDSELHRVELDGQQAELDHQKAIANPNLAGERLAVAVSEAEERATAVQKRLGNARAGAKTIRNLVAQAEVKARAAVHEYLASVVFSKLDAERAKTESTLRKRLASVIEPIVDELAVLDAVGRMIATRKGVQETVETILSQPAKA